MKITVVGSLIELKKGFELLAIDHYYANIRDRIFSWETLMLKPVSVESQLGLIIFRTLLTGLCNVNLSKLLLNHI